MNICICSSEHVSWLCYDLCGDSSCQWKTAWARIPLVSLCCFLFTELSLNSSSLQKPMLLWVTHIHRRTHCTCKTHFPLIQCNIWCRPWLLVGVCLARWFYFSLLCWLHCWLMVMRTAFVTLYSSFQSFVSYMYQLANIWMMCINITTWILYQTFLFFCNCLSLKMMEYIPKTALPSARLGHDGPVFWRGSLFASLIYNA